eukprot:jgi/Psemu1/9786/gm1.9786_g
MSDLELSKDTYMCLYSSSSSHTNSDHFPPLVLLPLQDNSSMTPLRDHEHENTYSFSPRPPSECDENNQSQDQNETIGMDEPASSSRQVSAFTTTTDSTQTKNNDTDFSNEVCPSCTFSDCTVPASFDSRRELLACMIDTALAIVMEDWIVSSV